MTGEELGTELLKRLAEVQMGKAPKEPSSADITLMSQKLSKPEYDNFYYMSQIGNLIVGLSKQETAFVHQFYRWFNVLDASAAEIIRAERTVKENPGINAKYLMTLENFAKDPHTDNLEGLENNYSLIHASFRGLLAAESLMRILMKTYKLPFMKCYCYDIDSVVEDFELLNAKLDEIRKYVKPQNKEIFENFHKLDANDMILDKDMLKLTEKVAFLSKFDPLVLTWCSNYEVILNNLMGFELFPNPNWIISYLRPDGTKYGTFKYPDKDGIYEGGIY